MRVAVDSINDWVKQTVILVSRYLGMDSENVTVTDDIRKALSKDKESKLAAKVQDLQASIKQWKKIDEGREYVIISYRIGQPSYSDKGLTMIDEARKELVSIKARRIRKQEKTNGTTST